MRPMETGRRNAFARTAFALAAMGALMTFGMAAQQPQSGPSQDSGTGARAVRLSYVEGSVQLSMSGTILAQEAPINTPLFEGTRITTADDGRAEIQFEDGSVARVAPDSSLTLSVLRQGTNGPETEMLLNNGLAYFELQEGQQQGSTQIRFGNNVVTATGFTILRVDLDNPPGALAVFSGNAHLDGGPEVSMDVHGGETLTLEPGGAQPFQVAETIDQNSWDQWNSDRDQALTAEETDRTAATSTVAQGNSPAWSDLDSNGNWYNVPGTGYVWSPYSAENAGWDPYGCGNWVWMPPYGYIWASCETWGYLPYQTGSWGWYDGIGWGWYPNGGQPWWYGGGGYSFNLRNVPQSYLPPQKPLGGPVNPRGGPVMPKGNNRFSHPVGGVVSHPVIAYNRLQQSNSDVALRTRSAPVMVNGGPVAPMQPVSGRPFYDNRNHGDVRVNGGGPVRYGYVPSPNQRVQGQGDFRNTYEQRNGYSAPNQPAYRGNMQRPTSGAWSPRPSAPSRSEGGNSHPSFGGGRPSSGGGGGGAHPSFGGGGGGSPHMSGGGGGGGHPSGGGGHPR